MLVVSGNEVLKIIIITLFHSILQYAVCCSLSWKYNTMSSTEDLSII